MCRHLWCSARSTGGPVALSTVFKGLPGDVPAAFVAVQHVDARFAEGLGAWLHAGTALPVVVAQGGEEPQAGRILAIAGNDDFVLDANGRLSRIPADRGFFHPCVDLFFESVARTWPKAGIAVLMTGMGRDGAVGLRRLKDVGWHTIAQDAQTSIVYGMPRAAAELEGCRRSAAARKDRGSHSPATDAAASGARDARMTTSPMMTGAAKAHRITVLLVDDQAMIGEAVRRMLEEEADIDFHFCEDATKALDTASTVRPTVILLDLVMPDMDGLTLLKFLRASDETRDVPVIVLSSKEEPVTKAEAFGLGASDYIVKLPDPIELIARVRHHSGGYIAQLERNETYEALVHELQTAAKYVRGLLPKPIEGPIATDWRFMPSVQLGGDAFGYHDLDPRRIVIYLLDVSGHGVKSALLSITAMNALRTRSLLDADFGDPAAVLAALNDAFQMEQDNNLYFTIWYGVFDRETRQLTYANAGHPPGLMVAPSDGEMSVAALGDPGVPIGMMSGLPYTSGTATVPERALLFLYSDGAYEITQPDGAMWTHEAFSELLRTNAPNAGLLPLDIVVKTITTVRGSDRFEDDVSMLEVRFE